MQKDLYIFGETVKDYVALLASIRVSTWRKIALFHLSLMHEETFSILSPSLDPPYFSFLTSSHFPVLVHAFMQVHLHCTALYCDYMYLHNSN